MAALWLTAGRAEISPLLVEAPADDAHLTTWHLMLVLETYQHAALLICY
jgi:hypothetical protein